jgi:hypothetical protein
MYRGQLNQQDLNYPFSKTKAVCHNPQTAFVILQVVVATSPG